VLFIKYTRHLLGHRNITKGLFSQSHHHRRHRGYTGAYMGVIHGVMERCHIQQYCNMNFFCTTPRAENGQPTVNCRDQLIVQAPKCTRTAFSRSFAPDPTGRAYSVHPCPWPRSWWDGGLLPIPKNSTPSPLLAVGAQASAVRALYHGVATCVAMDD